MRNLNWQVVFNPTICGSFSTQQKQPTALQVDIWRPIYPGGNKTPPYISPPTSRASIFHPPTFLQMGQRFSFLFICKSSNPARIGRGEPRHLLGWRSALGTSGMVSMRRLPHTANYTALVRAAVNKGALLPHQTRSLIWRRHLLICDARAKENTLEM